MEPFSALRRQRTKVALALLLIAFLLLPGWAAAQTLQVGLGAGSSGGAPAGSGAVAGGAVGANAWLRVDGYRPQGATPATVTFEVRLPRPQVGLGLTTNRSFGPLGNLVFEAWGAVAPHPLGGAAAEGLLTARGVLGPVAVRLGLVGFGANVGAFRPAQLASSERPQLSGPAAGVQLSLTWRVERDLILEAAPELYLTRTGPALRVDAGVRLLRAVGAHELRVDVHTYATPGFGSVAAAVGPTVVFNRGRDPDVSVGASVGYSQHGWWPGLRLAFGQRLGRVRVDFAGALEPYRLDLPALRLTADVRAPVTGFLPAGTELTVSAAVTSSLGLYDLPATRAWAGVALAFPVELR